MSMELNKALDLLREIRPSIPKEVLELWCKDRDAFLASHPAVDQAGGDERAAFEAYRDRRNALLESDGHKPGSKWHVTNAHYPTWEASRAALAQPSPAQAEQAEAERLREAYEWGYGDGQNNPNGYSDKKERDACVNELLKQPSPAQAEAERPEVVARVVHSNPVVLGQCGPLNANDELMTVAQHAASVARWAEMFNRVEQQRDAALAEVAGLRSLLNSLLCYVERDIDRMRSDRDKSDNKEIYDRSISLAMERLKAAQNAVFTTEPGCDTAVELAAQTTQAQHSVPEGWMLVPVEPLLNMMSDKDHDTRITAERQLLSILAAAPGKEGV